MDPFKFELSHGNIEQEQHDRYDQQYKSGIILFGHHRYEIFINSVRVHKIFDHFAGACFRQFLEEQCRIFPRLIKNYIIFSRIRIFKVRFIRINNISLPVKQFHDQLVNTRRFRTKLLIL